MCSGDDREFPPSSYKFSLFGSYVGPSDNIYVNQFISQDKSESNRIKVAFLPRISNQLFENIVAATDMVSMT